MIPCCSHRSRSIDAAVAMVVGGRVGVALLNREGIVVVAVVAPIVAVVVDTCLKSGTFLVLR